MFGIEFLAMLAVLVLGILASLLPGLHPNSIGAVLGPWLSGWPDWPYALVALLGVRMALQFLPSILMGAPSGETGLSLLPGARMLRAGRGMEAVAVCAWAVGLASLAGLMLAPFLLPVLPAAFALVKPWTGYLLLLASALLILSEGRPGHKLEAGRLEAGRLRSGPAFGLAIPARLHGPLRALAVFLMAGALGWLTLDLPLLDPLFCLFVGFFTLPILLAPEEAVRARKRQKGLGPVSRDILPYIALGIVLGGLADLLPGLSTPAQIAGIATLAVPLSAPAHFLALVASIEASHTAFAFSSAAGAGVARVGVVAMAAQVMPVRAETLPALLGTYALAVAAGAGALVMVGGWLLPRWGKLDWKNLSRLIGAYLVAAVFLNDGILGLAVLGVATCLGLLAVRGGVRRTHVMGSLILPAMGHAFGF